jgi:hypothetical protein
MCTPPLAARLRKTPVGLTPFVGFSLRHIPAHRKPTVCLIRWAGTSHTAGTLNESFAGYVRNNENLIKYYLIMAKSYQFASYNQKELLFI